MMKRFFVGLLQLVAPARCAACDQFLLGEERDFCGACLPLLELNRAMPGEDRAACVYGGPVADALQRLKYRGTVDGVPALARLFAAQLETLAGQVGLVTAVPLAPAKLRRRGYNQAALLAQPVARGLGAPFRPRALFRARAGHSQVGADREARARQLAEAFVARDVRGASVLVVDDVRTTGATLGEARRALLAAGAARVFTLALAQTP
jgi:ComF family protein